MMRQQIRIFVEVIRTSIWIVPLGLAALSLGLAILSLWFDYLGLVRVPPWQLDPTAVRMTLATAGGAVISLAAVSVSMAMVALTMAAGQLGPKLLRQYLARPDHKVVLGLFVGAFIFDLVALAGTASQQIPITLGIAIIATIAALGGFVVFVHRIARSLHADEVVALLGEDLEEALDNLLLEEFQDEESDDGDSNRKADWDETVTGKSVSPVRSKQAGYVQTIGYRQLAGDGKENQRHWDVQVHAGNFVVPGMILAYLHGQSGDDDAADVVTTAIVIARQRTPVQDVEFPIAQIMQVAARALSPGINDPATAIACIDWLSAGLSRAARSRLPPYCFRDDDGVLRVRGQSTTFQGLMDLVFHPLRQYACSNLEVTLNLLDALFRIAISERSASRHSVVSAHAQVIVESAHGHFEMDVDRAALAQRIDRLRGVLTPTSRGREAIDPASAQGGA